MSSAADSSPGVGTASKRHSTRIVAIVMTVVFAVWGAMELIRTERALSAAQSFLKQQRPEQAEAALDRYLTLHRNDPEAILLWAEAVVSGNTRTPVEAAKLASSRLQMIPRSSVRSAEARMREGRLALLILHQPDRAEKLLRQSTAQDPDILDSHYLLWKLFDLTERFQRSEPHFWRTLELTPESRRTERLREWYLSQFSPGTANAELDRNMGFLKGDQQPGPDSDLARLEQFYSSEPEAPMVVAALAQWFLRNRERSEALDLLMRLPADGIATSDSFYVATVVTTLLDLGRLTEARDFFQKWPEPREGYDYWNSAGRIAELVDRDDQSAIHAYEQAVGIWPGPAEWPTMHRLAQCLARNGDRAKAEQVRQKAKQTELMMEGEVHQRLRTSLANLDSPDTARQMAEFYEKLGRARESDCWRDVEARLSAPSAAVYSRPDPGPPW